MLDVKAGNIASSRGVTAPSSTSAPEMIRSSMTINIEIVRIFVTMFWSIEHLKRSRYAHLSVPWTEEGGKGSNLREDVTA
jgi:hypothetical protein